MLRKQLSKETNLMINARRLSLRSRRTERSSKILIMSSVLSSEKTMARTTTSLHLLSLINQILISIARVDKVDKVWWLFLRKTVDQGVNSLPED